MELTKKKLLELLKENQYILHPHFECFYTPKKAMGYLFHVTDTEVTVYRVKWKQLDLQQGFKSFNLKTFNPYQFDVKDKQAELLRLQTICNQQNHNKKVKEQTRQLVRKTSPDEDDVQIELLT